MHGGRTCDVAAILLRETGRSCRMSTIMVVVVVNLVGSCGRDAYNRSPRTSGMVRAVTDGHKAMQARSRGNASRESPSRALSSPARSPSANADAVRLTPSCSASPRHAPRPAFLSTPDPQAIARTSTSHSAEFDLKSAHSYTRILGSQRLPCLRGLAAHLAPPQAVDHSPPFQSSVRSLRRRASYHPRRLRPRS